ncbi:hypothetical protein F511_40285 [Dorcoceras hygrometricum]|uniref:Uncharacterized protein n=1 Tax=Dorcoceras hygrometricum TaxID=472368 RepID=A0A2Z7BBH5_9LAMI|nr:hypothetical protein F511_40285 [Dorcoceras hygrometricum]
MYAGSIDVHSLLMEAKLELVSVALDAEPIQTVDPTSADDVDTIIEQVVAETTRMDTDEELETVAFETSVETQRVKTFVEPEAAKGTEMGTVLKDPTVTQPDNILVAVTENPAATTAKEIVLAPVADVEQLSFDEELMSIDDLLKRIPGDMMLPSILAAEPTKIKFGLGISIPGVANGDLYKLMENVIDEVSAFYHSFSLRRLAVLQSLNKDIAAKEENVLTWAETDSVQVALQRKVYILAKYREMLLRKFLESHRANFSPGQTWSVMALQIIDLLSVAHSTAVKHLLMQKQTLELQWTRPCCSMLFESTFDRGFYIPRNHKIIVSTCWIRLLRRIGDVWVVEDGYDRWVHEDETPVSQPLVQLPQRISLEPLAPICLFFPPVQCLSASTLLFNTLGWHRVCTEILRYSMFGCLKPVGSFTICTDIVPIGPVLGVFGILRRVVDNVSYRIQILDSAPTDFVPSSPHQSSTSTSSMHFTDEVPQGTTTAVGSTPIVAQFSLPSAVSDSFNDLRTSMSRIISLQSKESRRLDDSHNEVLDKIKQLETTILDAFYHQNQAFHRLITGIRQEAHNDTNVLSLGLKAFRTQTPILSTYQADARKEEKDQKAIIEDMDERLATLRSGQLDFRAQAHENYNHLSSQLGELVAYINRGNEKKGEDSSSRRPQPPPDDLNRPSGGNASRGGGGGGSGGSDRRYDRKGSSTKRGSGSGGAGGP